VWNAVESAETPFLDRRWDGRFWRGARGTASDMKARHSRTSEAMSELAELPVAPGIARSGRLIASGSQVRIPGEIRTCFRTHGQALVPQPTAGAASVRV
jgi:hypothetical protein